MVIYDSETLLHNVIFVFEGFAVPNDTIVAIMLLGMLLLLLLLSVLLLLLSMLMLLLPGYIHVGMQLYG